MGSQAPLGTKSLFSTPGAALPGYVREIARELMKKGKTKSQAIQMAIGICQRWAAEGKPKAVAAIAQWEAAKAKAHATPDKADLANDHTPDFSGKGMIVLEVPEGTIEPVKGGLSADDMHVTLQFLGDDVTDEQFAKAVRRALSATEVGPVAGYVGGLGVFPAQDGKQAVWCPVDVPGIARLHDYVSGGERAQDHGFTPHVTIRWGAEGDKLPTPVPRTPVTFTHIIVKRGDQVIRLPLGYEGDRYDRPAESRYANPLALSGRQVLLAQDDGTGHAVKKTEKKKPPPKGDGAGGKQQFKHGWIPVDENGKATGPAQKPPWLKQAEAAHAAAGGRTAETIQKEKAQAEFKARADKAAAPAKKAAAEAKRKKAELERSAKKKETAKKAAERKTEQAANAKKRDSERKQKDRAALVSRAYKQALADRKAGRELSDTQRRVIAHVESEQKKDAAKLRNVDVPGANGSTVAAKAPAKKPTTAALAKVKAKAAGAKAKAKAAGAVTSNTAVKAPAKVRMRSMKNRDRRTRTGVRNYSNDGDDVNALDFAGQHFPGGQLAFRYKHGWILINPAIPSRGMGGGGLAAKHGHKSGTVTHGNFATGADGKKVFVPSRTGGKTAAQKVAALKAKNTPAIVGGKVNYKKPEKSKFGLVAAQKDTGGSALHPSTPSATEVKAKKDAATKAAITAKQSNSIPDAQVAAKKYADAFVAQKKAGDTAGAENSKSSAQAWAKKAQQLKQAEKATAAAKAKHEAEQAAEKKAAQEKAHALSEKLKEEKVKAAKAEHSQLQADAITAYSDAYNMPEDTPAEMKAKAEAFDKSAKASGALLQHAAKHDFPDNPLAAAKLSQVQKLSADLKAKAKKEEFKDASLKLYEGYHASHPELAEQVKQKSLSDAADGKNNVTAADFDAVDKKVAAEKKAKAPKAETVPKAAPTMALADAIDDVLDDLPTLAGETHAWDDYLHASAAYKKSPTPANLKKLSAAQKALTADGVTSDNLQVANKNLFGKLGMSAKAPAKKTVAQKSAAKKTVTKITAKGKTEVKKITAEPITSSPAPEVKVPEISLPGPGMYADGNAIMKGKKKADAMPDGPAKDAQLTAVSNAMKAFQAKHNKSFDINAVEDMGGTFVPQHGADLTAHPAYADAVADGFTPVNEDDSANGDWKPSQVPGLKSTKGAYHYSGGSYTVINAQLRKHKSPTGGTNDAAIAQMDKEFAAVPPLDAPIVLTRRMGTRGPFPEIPPPMEPGAVYKDHGYSSTSKDPGVWSGNVVMQVRVPKGAKVMDLNHTTGSQHSSEQEVLLNRGSQYRIVSDEQKAGERRIVVELVV